MDRQIDQTNAGWKKGGKLLKWLLIALAILGAGYYGLRLLAPSADEGKLRFATVETGDIANTINATALVLPAFEEQVNAPVATTIEEVLLFPGSEVAAGELLMKLDRDYVGLQLDGRRDQLSVKQNKINLLNLEYDRDLKALGYNAQIKKLELASAEAQLADARRLLKVGGATEEEVEAAELAVQITRLESDKLENELNYSRNSLAGRKRQLQLEVGIEEKEVRQLSRKLRETEVRAPRPGVITWVNESIGQQVPEGAPLARIANLGRYKIEATCSDRYADQLKVGQEVDLRLANVRLAGEVTDILPEIKDNTITFRVELDEAAHEQLRPNLRAELNVITSRREGITRVKNGPAFRGGVRQSVFVVRGNEATRVEVGTGMRNGDFVEITSGLRVGDRIIISDTEELERVSAFTINE
ncbi:efflux RND transporter periplasmic adaptor subunit [Lewinella sp. 4G2]|uniref:efflux RND transporter periplasmic adaptor subunit n=1 Tax=Lewinella sp. 4G2 TaxID=1803372 RepID=UPI0007B49AB2|nr:HlyD family efflux transporter periplasmic adaptor subunit [Lewinella sp. 4G2]OAV42673.1 hypothetical protein A3850_015640 [Lewinella sp. 4G2]